MPPEPMELSMLPQARIICAQFLLMTLVFMGAGSGATAQEGAWRVSKSSGDVSVTTSGAQQVSLTDETTLRPGDNIRTGRNGRVLLVRGEESILIAPNSVIGIPEEKKEDGWTTVIQRAGSILLEVEKRNVKHFEVTTPYLAAVVKGTQFQVTVNNNETHVDVFRGQVEVTDFKSGQLALVLPGQSAKVSAHGPGGLSLHGAGTLSPIQQGEPRAPSVSPLSKEERSALRGISNGQKLHIASPLGDVKLNIHQVTKGLAHAEIGSASLRRDKETGANAGQSNNDGGNAFAKETSGGSGSISSGNSGSGLGNGGAGGLGNGLASGLGNGLGNGVGGGLNGSNSAVGIGSGGLLPPGLGGIPPGQAKKH